MENKEIPIDDLLPTVLDIDVHHYVRDQSAALNYDENKRIDYRNLKPGEPVESGSHVLGRIMVEEVSEDSLTITYGGETRTLALDDEWKIGPCVIDCNPYLSSDEITMTLSYYVRTPWMQIPDLMEKIMKVHENADNSVIAETAEDEQRVLALLDVEFQTRGVGSWPLKALLSACNNWHSAVIVRLGQFQEILLEGIENGALSPDDAEGWSWMKVAAETNDPESFMTDMDRYYDLLASAVENGNTDALDIMNEIWEPEQIIEED